MATAAGVLSSFRGVTRRPADLHNDCSSAKMLLPIFKRLFRLSDARQQAQCKYIPARQKLVYSKTVGNLPSWLHGCGWVSGPPNPKPEILNPKPHILKPYSGDSISSRTPALERFRATGRKKSISTLPAFFV